MNNAGYIKAGLIGHPVAHSKSPVIHNYWIDKYGMNGSYSCLDVASGSLEEAVADLKSKGFAGFNVTVPHKQEIMRFCDEIDETATAIGAVNTVSIGRDGTVRGMNTDAFGFIGNIREQAPDFDFTAGPVTVLGAGGAARAVVYALLEAGVPRLFISGRTYRRAEELARGALYPDRVEVLRWEDREKPLESACMLVNASSAGMSGMPPLEISIEKLPPSALVHDIVYAPLMTELLTKAKAAGNPVATGTGMLLHQARPAFAEWFGTMPEVTAELREKVLS